MREEGSLSLPFHPLSMCSFQSDVNHSHSSAQCKILEFGSHTVVNEIVTDRVTSSGKLKEIHIRIIYQSQKLSAGPPSLALGLKKIGQESSFTTTHPWAQAALR